MNKVKDRILLNEKRLDDVLLSINDLNKSLSSFRSNKKNITMLKKYYGSNNWFKDKELFETKKITDIKAGVLSEDSVWNMLDDLDDLIKEMKLIIKEYDK